MSDEDNNPIHNKDILQVLKAQSEAMMNMNERIAELETITIQQQDVIAKIVESISIMSDKQDPN